jgi:RHS repeat-associated protein
MPVTQYIWDRDNVLYESDDADELVVEYLYEPQQYGRLVSELRGAVTYMHYYDALGSTVALTDQNGNVTDTYVYSATGEELHRIGTSESPFRWNGDSGYYWDVEVQMYYVRARTYSPPLSRWLSEDPLGFVAGPNKYRYVAGQPTTLSDPSGKDFIALADRLVKLVGNKWFYHYSLQWWLCQCDLPDSFVNKVWDEETLQIACSFNGHNGQKHKSVELLARSGWWVRPYSIFAPDLPALPLPLPIKISEINYSDSSDRIMPIYLGSHMVVQLIWEMSVVPSAANYEWAEQAPRGQTGPLYRWRQSLYDVDATNSNTFVRYLLSVNGLPTNEMPGFHPGDMTPEQNQDVAGGYFYKSSCVPKKSYADAFNEACP